ncbi:MAG: helical backbone metal receptor [Omnitrophica WOR_2 bacterium]
MAAGNGFKKTIQFEKPPRRVVSLVPSMTESLFDLGFGDSVVGVTDYCIYPENAVKKLPKVGGPKNPRLDEILSLKPDLILANQEENNRQVVEALEAAGERVWVTFPKTVRQAVDVLWVLVGIYQDRQAAARLETLEMSLEWAESAAASAQPVRYFCPIWKDTTSGNEPWWMTFNHETYCHDLLRLAGGENVFASRERRYPLSADLKNISVKLEKEDYKGDTRYPRVPLDEIRAADPEIILLPNEPFAFEQRHADELHRLLPDVKAVRNGKVHLIEGNLITWHGTRLGLALRELPGLFM